MKLVRENLNELLFSKGIEGVREGPLRKEKRGDEWWVMGRGELLFAEDEEDADRIIRNIIRNI